MGQTVNLSGSTLSVSGSWCHQKANGIAPNVPRDTGNKKVESVRFTSVIFTDRNQINSERNSLFVSLYREAFKKKCDKCQALTPPPSPSLPNCHFDCKKIA